MCKRLCGIVNEPGQNIYIYVNDFNKKIRKNLLKLKSFAVEIDLLTGSREFIIYNKNTTNQEDSDSDTILDISSFISLNTHFMHFAAYESA